MFAKQGIFEQSGGRLQKNSSFAAGLDKKSAPAFAAPPRVAPLFESSPRVARQKERQQRAKLGEYQIVANRDVMTLEEVAANFTCGNTHTARKMLNESAAPRECAPGLYRFDEIGDFFTDRPTIAGSRAYARRHANSFGATARYQEQKFSLFAESAPESRKVSLQTAAGLYFKGSEIAALTHLKDKGLYHAHDRSGRYLDKDFR